MFVVTLSKTSLKKLGLGAMCCALVVCSALLGRFISHRTVAVSAAVNKIESAQDIQTWFTGYGLGGAIPFALELVRQLAGQAEADRIQNAIAYRH